MGLRELASVAVEEDRVRVERRRVRLLAEATRRCSSLLPWCWGLVLATQDLDPNTQLRTRLLERHEDVRI